MVFGAKNGRFQPKLFKLLLIEVKQKLILFKVKVRGVINQVLPFE